MSSKGRFLIIDGSNLIYRAFYALPRLTSSDGTPTGAVYGFVSSLQKVRDRFSPAYVCVVLDAPGPTFREELYAGYKETRQKMPEDIAVQIPIIREIVELSGVTSVELAGVEADDVIGSLCRKGRQMGLEVVLVSSDKDLCQLIGEGVSMFDSLKDRLIEAADVREKFGVGPESIVDLIALSGDQTDNIPGVPGIGNKTAASLLKQYGTVENLLKNLDFIKGKRGNLLRENRENIEISRELATLKEDVPLTLDMDDFVPREPDPESLSEALRKLGFRMRREEGREEEAGRGGAAPAGTPVSYETLDDPVKARESLYVPEGATVALMPLNGEEDGVVGLSTGERNFVAPAGVIGEIIGLLAEKGARVVSHDLKSAVKNLETLEGVFDLSYGDTMLSSYLLHPEESSLALSRMAERYTGKEVGDEGGSSPVVAATRAEATFHLSSVLEKRLEEGGFTRLYDELELPLLRVLYEMEKRGVRLDGSRLEALSIRLERELEEIEERISRYSGGEVNLASPKQVAFLLFEKLGLPPVKRTKTGFSTDMEVLEQLGSQHDAPALILEHRTLSKLKSTYVDVLPQMVCPDTGRVHTSFNQMQTATGRLSSSNPNLQNIPVRTDYGREIREAFVPEDDFVFVGADYSQIELRILAHLSRDEKLIDVFEKNGDVHRETAVALFGVGEGEVTPELRRRAKIVNFGILYGMTPFGLSRELKIPQPEARKYIDDYFNRYPLVREFVEKTLQGARESGFVETLLGRRRYLRDINSRNQALRQAAERMGVNAPVQGTAADIIKMSMVELFGWLKKEEVDARIILQVHDELILEARSRDAQMVGALLKNVMEGVLSLSVPLKVDVKIGYSWGEL